MDTQTLYRCSVATHDDIGLQCDSFGFTGTATQLPQSINGWSWRFVPDAIDNAIVVRRSDIFLYEFEHLIK